MMKKINLYEAGEFGDKGLKKLLVHDSPHFKIINFNFKAGQELPVQSKFKAKAFVPRALVAA